MKYIPLFLVILSSCAETHTKNNIPIILPKQEAQDELHSIEKTKPHLYEYVDQIQRREICFMGKCPK